MGTPFMGELKLISWNYAPKGWAFANGQLLPINQNQALFSLFGTMYGGDGRVNFALPDMRGRTSIHMGSENTIGTRGGEPAHTVTMQEMPTHNHFMTATSATGDLVGPAGNLLADSPALLYSTNASNLTPLRPDSVTNTGGSQPHENRQPYLVLNYIVALQGVFPSRN